MQKTILSLLLCSALVAPALAKKVSDRTHTFSFEAPDDWRFVAPSGSAARVPNTILLARSDKKQMVGVRGIKSYRKTQPDLDQWADLTAALFSTVTHRPTAVMEWKADNEPARLMDGLFGKYDAIYRLDYAKKWLCRADVRHFRKRRQFSHS